MPTSKVSDASKAKRMDFSTYDGAAVAAGGGLKTLLEAGWKRGRFVFLFKKKVGPVVH